MIDAIPILHVPRTVEKQCCVGLLYCPGLNVNQHSTVNCPGLSYVAMWGTVTRLVWRECVGLLENVNIGAPLRSPTSAPGLSRSGPGVSEKLPPYVPGFDSVLLSTAAVPVSSPSRQ